MRECLNPDCDRDIISGGVCVSCANSNYNPKVDGIDIEGYETTHSRKSTGGRY